MRWVYRNHVKDATVTALTENPNYLITEAFADTRLTRYGRTLDDAAQDIVMDLGSTSLNVNYCLIVDHNFTSGATIKIQANTSNSWTTPPVDQTLTYNSGTIIYNFTATQTYRYWRLYVNDSSNPDTYLQISKVWLGDYLQLPYMSKSQKIPTASTSTSQESISGQSYGDKKLIYNYGTITFPFVTDTEKTQIDAVFEIVDKTDPLYILVWEEDLTFQPPIYSRLTTDLDWSRVEGITGRVWSLQFGFKEIF